MIELLSPGGNLYKIKTAINYGADAVYTGYKDFGLRSRAGNLDKKELKEAISFVHKNNKKLYLTLNSYIFDDEMEQLSDFLRFLNDYPPDALIVSDLGVLNIVNQITKIPVHISTQANITNSSAANLLKNFNVDRVVIAREMNLSNIRRFTKNSSVGTEAFIHGAMCMAYSGRCFISSYLTGRSANRGDCTQSCRWKYSIVEEKRSDKPLYIEEHKEGSFIFNSYDMCAIEILDEIINAGVTALKIEGRMKSAYYVAVTTAVYRDAIDTILSGGNFREKVPFYINELKKISHRPYSLGFYRNQPGQYTQSSGYERKCDFVGVVEYCKDNKIFIKVKDKITPGFYEFFTKDLNIIPIEITELYDINSNGKKEANPNDFIYIKSPFKLNNFDILRRCEI